MTKSINAKLYKFICHTTLPQIIFYKDYNIHKYKALQIYLYAIQLNHKLYYTTNKDYYIHKCGALTKHTNDINEKNTFYLFWKLLWMQYTGCNKLECDHKGATSIASCLNFIGIIISKLYFYLYFPLGCNDKNFIFLLKSSCYSNMTNLKSSGIR